MDGEYSRTDVLRRTTYHMIKLGFQSRQTGYRYLREAVWLVYDKPDLLSCVTKRLYPEVAKAFGTTDKQVERAIRCTIESAWACGDREVLKAFFGAVYSDGGTRPTNTQVISVFVNIFE